MHTLFFRILLEFSKTRKVSHLPDIISALHVNNLARRAMSNDTYTYIYISVQIYICISVDDHKTDTPKERRRRKISFDSYARERQ